jgi:hypothetical protein
MRTYRQIKVLKRVVVARHWWLTPLILVTRETESRRTVVQIQTQASSSRDPNSKIFN